MLSNTLNTNEVKDSTNTAIGFQRISSNNRETVFAKIGESPALRLRLSVKHEEIGTGINRRRRSVTRIDQEVVSDVDNTTVVDDLGYFVKDTPIGALTTTTPSKNTIAMLLTFLATKGGTSTVQVDGTGTGAEVILTGSL